jgi:hypothetical protein
MPASLRLPLQHAGVLGPVAPAASGVGPLLRILPIRLRREKQFLTVPVPPFKKKQERNRLPKKVFKKTNHYFSLIYWRVSFLGETKKRNTSKLRRQDWRNHLS